MIEQTTKVGIVNNCLGYLIKCESKGHFTYGCMLGLGSNFKYELREKLGEKIVEIAQERILDPKNMLMNYFDIEKKTWSTFV